MAGTAHARMQMHGFTLIEAAVVLVIIGFVLVAVLQGQQMIAGARYKSLMNDIGNYREAFESFKERYNALPGDFANANNRLGLSGANGNGNGLIDGGPRCDSDGEESCRAWQHLRAARLINGDDTISTTDAPPEHAFGGVVSAFFTGSDGNGEFGHKLLIETIPPEFATRMDEDLDDGNATTGWISCEGGNCTGGTDWPDVDDPEVNIVYAL